MSPVLFCTKRSPTRMAGTSIAAITSINSRVRRLIGASFRAQKSADMVVSDVRNCLRGGGRSGNIVLEYPLGRPESTREKWRPRLKVMFNRHHPPWAQL